MARKNAKTGGSPKEPPANPKARRKGGRPSKAKTMPGPDTVDPAVSRSARASRRRGRR